MADINPLPPNRNANELVYDTEAEHLRKARPDEASVGGGLHNKYIVCAAISVRLRLHPSQRQLLDGVLTDR